MKLPNSFAYRIILVIGLLLSLLMAWNSEGFYHYDEHYQIIEFAQYKAGKAVPEGLAWEFREKIRPGLQPFLAYLILKASAGIGLKDPFTIAFILRLISLVMSFFIAFSFGKWIAKESKMPAVANVFWVLILLFWCSSFLMVRFSSENWGGLAFIGGIIVLSDSRKWNFLLAGLLFGLAFQFRYQVALAIFGYLAWYLLKRKFSLQSWSMIVIGGLIATLIGLLFDFWLYGSWQFTAFKYFTTNVVENRASDFGVSPWYFYFKSLFLSLGPLLNILVISLFVYGWYRMINHPIVWACTVFVIGHILIPHKEMRFLFPMWFVFIGLVSTAIVDIYNSYKIKPIVFVPILTITLVLNSMLSFYRISTPAHKYIPYFRFIYEKAKITREVHMYYDDFNMYGYYGLRITFYRPGNLIQFPLAEPDISSKPFVTNSLMFQRGVIAERFRSSIKSTAFQLKTWDMSRFEHRLALPRKGFLDWNIYETR